jgi:nitrate reductase gamma subunit
MEAMLEFARGPLLVFAFGVLLLGLIRQVVLAVTEMVLSYRRAGDQVIPFRTLMWRSLGWVVPVKALRGTRIPYTLSSLLFHIGMLVTPLFLSGHVELIRRGIGLSWPTLSPAVADGLTLMTLTALILLFLLRLVSTASRFLTDFQDWFLLVLCMVPFMTGFLVAHPASNPFSFSLTYLIHLISAELLLMLIPFTKLVHAALFPFTQISWELGWHFVPRSGERVRLALGKEGEPV